MHFTANTFLRTLSLVTATSSLTACAAEGPDGSEGVDAVGVENMKLIGGVLAPADHFRSTVGIANRCSAAKVGPRTFLTAAHCVGAPRGRLPPGVIAREDGLAEDFVAGQKVLINYGLRPDDGQAAEYTIAETIIHPSWLESPFTTPTKGIETAADIAVFRILEDTPLIPEARVLLDRIAVGTDVVKLGWGCQTRANDPENSGLEPYKTHNTKIVTVDYVDHEQERGSFFSASQIQSIHETYAITAGRAQGATNASLCPGDSGGPLYLPSATERLVVGVNSDYTFLPTTEAGDLGGVSWTDWHTRTSRDSRHDVGQWLIDLGVNTVGGEPPASATGITLQRWNNVGGLSVNLIPIYRPADVTTVIPDFEIYPGSNDNGDNYGVRVLGYLTPPVTGNYVFSIAGDDNVSLRIATDEHSYNARIIAYHTGWTARRQWNKYSTQRSSSIPLVAGRRYYIEANVKEGAADDNLAVAWNLPGQHQQAPQVIPGTYLSPLGSSSASTCTCPSDCGAVQTRTVPFTAFGADRGCFFFAQLGYSINSFEMIQVNLNGRDITNRWVGNWEYPAKVGGGYYLYVSPRFAWSQTQLAP